LFVLGYLKNTVRFVFFVVITSFKLLQNSLGAIALLLVSYRLLRTEYVLQSSIVFDVIRNLGVFVRHQLVKKFWFTICGKQTE